MEVLKRLNHVQGRLLVWGDPFSESASEVIVCITGNPGIIDFYDIFCSELNTNTGLPVCLVGQSGHDIIPNERSYSLQNEGYLFDLRGQIEHKLDLINNHIHKDCRLHLIGHSIGAWMILESIQKNEQLMERVATINLLFPTLQEMAVTKNGPFVNTLRKIHSIAIFLLILFNMLPRFVLGLIAKTYLLFRNMPFHYTDRLIKYVNPNILDKVLFLAYDEMDTVRSLNTKAIANVKSVTNVIYSQDDGWVPLKYMEDLKKFLPLERMTEVAYTHEFVLKSSKEVAALVSVHINLNKK
ncbi:lipid droplet-associated hydrolase [Ostrinia furnacalis]|uniref:lipid droplet-associated hydrolase n=1 Tax=Ostrinia furnacalis TaxID=93504 RepID=UPI00103D02C7|nr:lipid droplet-associated hydrolase [Ostrinia furnacalis]